ncbi:hypothetical protein E2C01_053137 [Portunus trituberculatus]|uniref:Uncharacterized protein n=1 Tax=Portunus trituberculatus TaxID=210409 RepID=A0A5B7GJI3_PORTR|nr:hypothetical protein [Portunus trituberculatus]
MPLRPACPPPQGPPSILDMAMAGKNSNRRTPRGYNPFLLERRTGPGHFLKLNSVTSLTQAGAGGSLKRVKPATWDDTYITLRHKHNNSKIWLMVTHAET